MAQSLGTKGNYFFILFGSRYVWFALVGDTESARGDVSRTWKLGGRRVASGSAPSRGEAV